MEHGPPLNALHLFIYPLSKIGRYMASCGKSGPFRNIFNSFQFCPWAKTRQCTEFQEKRTKRHVQIDSVTDSKSIRKNLDLSQVFLGIAYTRGNFIYPFITNGAAYKSTGQLYSLEIGNFYVAFFCNLSTGGLIKRWCAVINSITAISDLAQFII